MIDVHCHLNFPEFNDTRSELIKETKKEFKYIIDSGASYESNIRSLKLSEKYNNFIKTTMGYHPQYSGTDNEESKTKIFNQIIDNLDNIKAIGEIGLDFSIKRPEYEIKKQYTVFEELLTIATEYNMPIVLHVRDAEKQALNIVKKYTEIPNVIFHSFSGTKETALEAVDYGYYISFSTNSLLSKKHKKCMKKVPLENMLTETDSPFLSPIKGELNQPLNIKKIIERISRAKKIDFKDIEKQTENNAKKVFSI